MSSPLSNVLDAGDPELADAVAAGVSADGYAIVRDVIDGPTCEALVAEVDRVEAEESIPLKR